MPGAPKRERSRPGGLQPGTGTGVRQSLDMEWTRRDLSPPQGIPEGDSRFHHGDSPPSDVRPTVRKPGRGKEGVGGLCRRQRRSEPRQRAQAVTDPAFFALPRLVHRFASTISYSGATPPSRSGLRSEPRPSGSGLSIGHRNSEYEYLVSDASGK